MSVTLQVALLIASLAATVLAICTIIVAFSTHRQLSRLAVTAEQLRVEVQALVQESRELVRSATEVSKLARGPMDEVGEVVSTIHQWTQRTDRLVDEVGSVLEPSVFMLARKTKLVRAGVAAFLAALLHRDQRGQTEEE